MPSLTNPGAIPSGKHDTIKAICLEHGPILVPDEFPKDEDGLDKEDLNPREMIEVFEAITKQYWNGMINQYEVEKAYQAAMENTTEKAFQ